MRRWDDLDEDERLRLRAAYQNHLECLAPGASSVSNAAAFAAWLAERGVAFDVEAFLATRSGRPPRE